MMKPRILLLAALVTASPVAAQTLVYQGNHQGGATCSTKGSNLATGCVMYDNITVGADGWNVSGLFGHFYQADVDGMAPWASAFWEIRSGMSEGNAGTLLFGGTVASATQEATGRSFTTSATFNEYIATLLVPEFFLAPGSYWIGIAPVVIESSALYVGAYASWTGVGSSGGINSQADGYGIAWINNSQNYVAQTHDFSYGVLGTLAEGGDPGNGNPGANPNVTVPEPATVTLFAAGLVAVVGLRRRKR